MKLTKTQEKIIKLMYKGYTLMIHQNDDYENAITLLYKVHPYIMGTNDELSDEIREFLLSIPDRNIFSYHHKCIKCKSIFKNNVTFYKSHKERICPNCISK